MAQTIRHAPASSNRVTDAQGRAPSSVRMCSRGLAMVALATMKRGSRWYSRAHTRRSRRSTSAAWHPNTPLRAGGRAKIGCCLSRPQGSGPRQA